MWCLNSSATLPAPLAARVLVLAVSVSVRRSISATTAARAPSTKGMRQPQALSSASVSSCCSTTTATTASSWPPISVTYWNDEKKPRWPRIATSLM
ncbi:hypothetical protein D9M68_655190 [compost metagenome]